MNFLGLSLLFLLLNTGTHPEGFGATTLVQTTKGPLLIKELNPSHILISYTPHQEYCTHTVNYFSKSVVPSSMYLEVQDEQIECSLQQLFYTPLLNKWTQAKDLRVDDALLTPNGIVSIKKAEIRQEEIEVFRVSLPSPHVFLITPLDIVVHNFIGISICYIIGEGVVWPTLGSILTSAGIYIYKRFVESAVGISSFKNFKKPNKENHPHNNLPPHKNRDNKPPGPPNGSGKDNGSDPEDPKKHPHGIYKPEGSAHGKKQRGSKSPEPENPQELLDQSVLVKEKDHSVRRTIWQDDETIAVFDSQRKGEFHGHTCTWHKAREDIKSALQENNLANHKGKRIG